MNLQQSIDQCLFTNDEVLFGKNLLNATKADIEVYFEEVDGMLVLMLKQTSNLAIEFVPRDRTKGACIMIPENTHAVLTLTLSPRFNWEFHGVAFRPKQLGHGQYFHYKVDQANKRNMELQVRSTGKPRAPVGDFRDDQPFELTVALSQPGPNETLVLVIDPDVKNPPPTGFPFITPPGQEPNLPSS